MSDREEEELDKQYHQEEQKEQIQEEEDQTKVDKGASQDQDQEFQTNHLPEKKFEIGPAEQDDDKFMDLCELAGQAELVDRKTGVEGDLESPYPYQESPERLRVAKEKKKQASVPEEDDEESVPDSNRKLQEGKERRKRRKEKEE